MDSKLLVGLLLIVLTFSISFASALRRATEGVDLLKRSRSALFPLNILYYYTGVLYLSQAVSQEPTNLDLRLVRATSLFDFVENNPLAQDTVLEDLEFFLLFREKYPLTTKVDLSLVYYILSYVSALRRDLPRFYYYVERLTERKDSGRFLELLKTRFPQLLKEPK